MAALFLVPTIVTLAALVLSSCANGSATDESAGMVQNLAVPPNVRVVAPKPGLTGEMAAFSGVWGGRWHGVTYGQAWSVDTLVIVEQIISSTDVIGTYVLGDYPPYVKAGHWRFRGTIADKTLRWEWGRDRLEFSLRDGPALYGERFVSGIQEPAQVILRKRSAVTEQSSVPVFLSTIDVTPPDVATPSSIAAFAGRWAGFSRQGRHRLLAVIWITPLGDASVMHAWDDSSRPEGFRPRYYTARIENGILTFAGGGDRYEFAMTSDGSLDGVLVRNGTKQPWGEISMLRVP